MAQSMTSETGHALSVLIEKMMMWPLEAHLGMGNSTLQQWILKSDSDQSYGLFGSDVILFLLLLVMSNNLLVAVKMPGLHEFSKESMLKFLGCK